MTYFGAPPAAIISKKVPKTGKPFACGMQSD